MTKKAIEITRRFTLPLEQGLYDYYCEWLPNPTIVITGIVKPIIVIPNDLYKTH